MTKIFISYSHTDEAFAAELAQRLTAEQYTVWFDRTNIRPGKDWADTIDEALNECDTMLLLLSPAAMQSDNVDDEWKYFRSASKRIIPVMLQPIDKIHFQLSKLQYVSFHEISYERAFNNLLIELRTDPSQLVDSHLVPLQAFSQPITEAYEQALEKIEQARVQQRQELDLSQLGLVRLPDQVGDLEHLRLLRLSRNHLRELPEALGRLHNLREIWLDGNQLHHLPLGMAQMRELRALFLANNRFRDFPGVLLQMPRVQIVRFSGNQLQSLPEGIHQMKDLVVFFLVDNHLDDLPLALGQLPNLVKFRVVEGNPLKTLPTDVVTQGDLALLQWLRQRTTNC